MLMPNSLNASTLSEKDPVNRPCYCKHLIIGFFLPLIECLTILVFSLAHPSRVLSIHVILCFPHPFKIAMSPKLMQSKHFRTSLFWYLLSQTLTQVVVTTATYFKRCIITPWNHYHQTGKGQETVFFLQ